MITIYLGNIGSGKTACAVREMLYNPGKKTFYTNIKTKKIKNVIFIKKEMIMKKELKKSVMHKNGEMENFYDYSLNKEFWQNVEKPISIILDEAHNLFSSRRAMSKQNIIFGNFLSMIRRVLGSTQESYGELILITQRSKGIDIIAREMSCNVRYFRGHYIKLCRNCRLSIKCTSDMPEEIYECPRCNSTNLKKLGHRIEVWHFTDMSGFDAWREFGISAYYRHYFINDISRVFNHYDTFQWSDIFESDY